MSVGVLGLADPVTGPVPGPPIEVVDQQPVWPDRRVAARVVADLAASAPTVAPRDCDRLRDALAAAGAGRAFVLQAGDCAETFAGAGRAGTARTVSLLRAMGSVIAAAAGVPVVGVGRIAGQYAKPRSRAVESRDGVDLPAYRGDAVNDVAFAPWARRPDPRRLLRAHRASARSVGDLRALAGGALVAPAGLALFTSHEALLLDYEVPLTRVDGRTGDRYGLSGHLLWIGERTRGPDGPHVRYAASVRNPVGVKLGPECTPAAALELAERLNPANEPGRLTLITRMGAGTARDALPRLVDGVTAGGAAVTWLCDPMHGNTVVAPGGLKTRHVGDVLDELTTFLDVHRALGTHAGGVHLELTGGDVTECVGGPGGVRPADLPLRYETACDPRLNRDQAVELACAVAGRHRRRRAA